MKRTAIYARVSSDEQANNFSLSSQVAAAKRYAETNELNVVDVLREDESGMTLDRPELDQLRAAIRQGELDAIIVHASDRLTRNPVHGDRLRSEFAAAGVELHYVARGRVENTPEGEMFAGIEEQFSKFWWAKIREATMRGRREKLEKGIVLGNGGAPYGYRKIGEKERTAFDIVEGEAEIVRLIYHWFVLDSVGATAIAARLTTEEIPTPGAPDHPRRKKGPYTWTYQTVRLILKNEAYAGTFQQNRYRAISKKSCVLRPREEWIPVAVPAIVDRTTWEAAQERIAQGRRIYHPPTKRHQYLMSRRLTCVCGFAATGHASGPTHKRPHGKWHLNYACNHPRLVSYLQCDWPHFRVEDVDNAVWDWIVSLLSDPYAMLEAFEEMQQQQNGEAEAIQEQIDAIDQQIARQQQRISQLLDLYLDNALGRAVLDQKRREIEGLLTELAVERAVIVQRLETTTITTDQIAVIEGFAQEVLPNLQEADFALKRQLVEALNLYGTFVIEDGVRMLDLHWYARRERLMIDRRDP